MSLQCLQRRDFVYTHQTAVADDIGGKDCYETAHAHSGNPAFRRPSINSFTFDCPAPGDKRRYCKGGIDLKHTRRRVVRLSVTSEMGEGGRETAVSCQIGGVLTKGFLPYDDGLVKATKLNKGLPNASKRHV